MNTCSFFCDLFASINWLWYAIAVVLSYAVGALWYSKLFAKTWIRVFKVEIPENSSQSNVFVTMLAQLVCTALLALILFMLTALSFWLALLTLIGFCGWQKGTLKFQFAKWKDYTQAAIINVGYLFIAGMISILLALL